ncbi:C6 zinc finger domain-containing protein [Phyllosticta capitalensis]
MGTPQGYHPSPYPQPSAYASTADYVGAGRKRQVRAVQACNNCRNRKQKCDEARPCQFCRESGMKCEYKEVPPPKQDRTLHDIATKVNMVLESFQTIQPRLERIERQLRSGSGQNGVGTLSTPSDHFPAPTPALAEDAEESAYDPVREMASSEPAANIAKTPSGFKYSNSSEPAQPPDSTHQETETAEYFDSEITLPADHTTAAHTMLMEWKAMKPFHLGVIPVGSNYPREEEENRGLLKLYGTGEGEDMYDGAHGGSPAYQNVEDDVVGTPAPSPGETLGWGSTLQGTGHVESYRSEPKHWGGLNPDGTLKLDARTVNRLYKSYMEHMFPLQPFLDSRRLAEMVKAFIQKYSPDPPSRHGAASAGSPFAVPDSYPSIPLKRKRSNNGPLPGMESSLPQPRRPPPVDRSIGNAIVLLILALGRVCEHKAHLPGPTGGPNTIVGSSLLPSMDSPPATIKQSPASEGPARNVDVTPGLAYYTVAVEIIGAVHGGNNISHGQAGVLAALYMGQLARVLESWAWIAYACRVLGVLIDKEESLPMDLRKVAPGVKSGVDPRRINLIRLLYWTCLQHESDILAEMSHLRPSGISKDEGRIGLPSGTWSTTPLDPPETMVWLFYFTQVQLRKILNRTHLALYSKGGRKKNFWAAIRDDLLEEQLQSWRDTVPAWMVWDDADEPSSDINHARMRAKYYGARYIISRPILHFAIHCNPAPHFLMKKYGYTESADSDEPESTEPLISDDTTKVSWYKVVRACKRCVDSAVASTIAFDNIQNENTRLIVTNIFGTAHAQFGNCLVLAAVRRSWMADLIPHETVVRLLERTIKFLRRIVPISPTLRVDVAILENTLKCLNEERRPHLPMPMTTDQAFGVSHEASI